MFKTLRSRLLLSYGLVIATMLIIVGISLFVVVAVSQRVRVQPQIQQLISLNRNTAQELRGAGISMRQLDVAGELIGQIAADNDVRIMLVESENQTVVYDSSSQIVGENISFSQVFGPNLADPTTLSPNSQIGRINLNGQRLLAHAQTLSPRAGNFILVHALPEGTPLSTVRTTFLRPLILASTAAVAVATVMAWLISRSVARPLQTMAVAAGAIAQGDYDQHIDVTGPHEVNTLGQSFNTMSSQVKQTQLAQRDFVANVSHDLKTPLTSIQGWSQAILDGAADTPEAQQHAAQVIHSEAGRMTRMVNQLLLLAKLEAGQLDQKRDPIDLIRIALEISRNMQFQAQEKPIALSTDIQTESAVVLGDADQITQAITNLVQNAISHTPPDGVVIVRVTAEGSDQYTISVIDTGPGIPEDALNRIFERFYQVDKARAGTQRGIGLGLSIVQQITAAHGGTISAESGEGQGSTFSLTLPASRDSHPNLESS